MSERRKLALDFALAAGGCSVITLAFAQYSVMLALGFLGFLLGVLSVMVAEAIATLRVLLKREAPDV